MRQRKEEIKNTQRKGLANGTNWMRLGNITQNT